MFIFTQEQLLSPSLDNLHEFVACWEKFYNYAPTDSEGIYLIDYISELSIGNNLTNEHIISLLRWKSPRHLTHQTRDGTRNPKVDAVVSIAKNINEFRNNKITCKEFFSISQRVFQSGYVYRAFLFHIARPFEYPIWDQHVARVHSLLTNRENSEDWEHYRNYRNWFYGLCQAMGVVRTKQNEANLRKIKRIDSALMAYGQFLSSYA
jgi:hypothetical protein